MKIFDCTTFFDEKMMMDVRFNILDKHVSNFIVVESLFSHSVPTTLLFLWFLYIQALA